MESNQSLSWLALAFAIILIIVGVYIATRTSKNPDVPVVTNFNQCTAAGYPVSESYPATCRTPDGQTFVQEIQVSPPVTPPPPLPTPSTSPGGPEYQL